MKFTLYNHCHDNKYTQYGICNTSDSVGIVQTIDFISLRLFTVRQFIKCHLLHVRLTCIVSFSFMAYSLTAYLALFPISKRSSSIKSTWALLFELFAINNNKSGGKYDTKGSMDKIYSCESNINYTTHAHRQSIKNKFILLLSWIHVLHSRTDFFLLPIFPICGIICFVHKVFFPSPPPYGFYLPPQLVQLFGYFTIIAWIVTAWLLKQFFCAICMYRFFLLFFLLH